MATWPFHGCSLFQTGCVFATFQRALRRVKREELNGVKSLRASRWEVQLQAAGVIFSLSTTFVLVGAIVDMYIIAQDGADPSDFLRLVGILAYFERCYQVYQVFYPKPRWVMGRQAWFDFCGASSDTKQERGSGSLRQLDFEYCGSRVALRCSPATLVDPRVREKFTASCSRSSL